MTSGEQGPEAQTATERHPPSPGRARGPEQSSEVIGYSECEGPLEIIWPNALLLTMIKAVEKTRTERAQDLAKSLSYFVRKLRAFDPTGFPV